MHAHKNPSSRMGGAAPRAHFATPPPRACSDRTIISPCRASEHCYRIAITRRCITHRRGAACIAAVLDAWGRLSCWEACFLIAEHAHRLACDVRRARGICGAHQRSIFNAHHFEACLRPRRCTGSTYCCIRRRRSDFASAAPKVAVVSGGAMSSSLTTRSWTAGRLRTRCASALGS